MLARGKHGKPTSAFPPFPPSLNIPQQRRDIHISTAPTIRPYIKVRLKTPALKPYTWGWAKLNFRSGPSAVAKSNRAYPGRPAIGREITELIVRMARENSDWGYDRIAGAQKNLGHDVLDQTVGNFRRSTWIINAVDSIDVHRLDGPR